MDDSGPVAAAQGVSVVAPCFNEADNIATLVTRTTPVLERLPEGSELVLVDDGSQDETWQQIVACASDSERVCSVRHDRNRGIEAAWLSGLRAAANPIVCLIDADLQNRPEDILRLHERLIREPAVDVVQGVRRPAQGERRLLLFSLALNQLLNHTFGMHLRDNKSGFLMCRRDVLERVLSHRLRYRYFQAFVGVSAGARGYRIGEVDTVFDHRHAGESFLNRVPILVSLRICWELAKFRFEMALDRRGRP